MRLLQSLKRAEEQGQKPARHVERAEDLRAETERRLRRKMRIHPRRTAMETQRNETEARRQKAA